MIYLPVGLAPRLRKWPWFSFIIAVLFFVASFTMGPQITRYQDRVEKAHEAATKKPASTRWVVPEETIKEKQQQNRALWKSMLVADPKLSRWIFQFEKKNFEALWINPWVIPEFFLMVLVALGFIFFGGFVESRMGSFLFGFNFLSLYYVGFLSEALKFSPPWGVTLGGTTALYILAGAYFALFPVRDICVWAGEEIRPLASFPVWMLASLGCICLEAFGIGGYSHVTSEISWGYFHFVILLLSYLVFAVTADARPLDPKYLSDEEPKLSKNLATASGGQARKIMKELIALNPTHLAPLFTYYKKVIAPLGSEPISPENQKFIDNYVGLLLAHFYDHQEFAKILEMLKSKPTAALPTAYFKLLHPNEWLVLARYADSKGEWAEAIRIYATMLDYFAQPKVRGEALKRAEVVIHRTFKEAIDRQTARRPILQQSKKFLNDYPGSKVTKILLDHVEHYKKVTSSESEDVA